MFDELKIEQNVLKITTDQLLNLKKKPILFFYIKKLSQKLYFMLQKKHIEMEA